MKPMSFKRFLYIVAVILLLTVMMFPFFWITVTSFKPSSEIFGATALNVFAEHPTLDNYRTVIDKGILNRCFAFHNRVCGGGVIAFGVCARALPL